MSANRKPGKVIHQWNLHGAAGSSKEEAVWITVRIKKRLIETMTGWAPVLVKEGIIKKETPHAVSKLLLEGGIRALDEQMKRKYQGGSPPSREIIDMREEVEKEETMIVTIRIKKELADALEFWAPVLVSEGKIKNNSAYAASRYVLENAIFALNEHMASTYAKGALSA